MEVGDELKIEDATFKVKGRPLIILGRIGRRALKVENELNDDRGAFSTMNFTGDGWVRLSKEEKLEQK